MSEFWGLDLVFAPWTFCIVSDIQVLQLLENKWKFFYVNFLPFSKLHV